MLELALLTLLTPLALTLETQVGESDLAEELRSCRTIQDRIVRLECYDRIAFGLEGEVEEPTVVEEQGGEVEEVEEVMEDEEGEEGEEGGANLTLTTGNWTVRTETEPSDGTAIASAMLPALEDESGHRKPVALIVRCLDEQTSIVIDWGKYLGSDSPTVTTRVDAHPPTTDKWSRSPDKQASFYNPLGGRKARQQKTVGFARQLLTAERLAARVVVLGESPVTAVFELSGIEQALRPIREACGW